MEARSQRSPESSEPAVPPAPRGTFDFDGLLQDIGLGEDGPCDEDDCIGLERLAELAKKMMLFLHTRGQVPETVEGARRLFRGRRDLYYVFDPHRSEVVDLGGVKRLAIALYGCSRHKIYAVYHADGWLLVRDVENIESELERYEQPTAIPDPNDPDPDDLEQLLLEQAERDETTERDIAALARDAQLGSQQTQVVDRRIEQHGFDTPDK